MPCAKCQKLSKGTSLATPEVKKKSEIYLGSSAGSSSKSATVGQNGVVKSKLLSKTAKNPIAQYQSSCIKCKTKTPQGHTYCYKCAGAFLCAICGKPNKKTTSKAPQISGQKFSLK